MKKIVFHTAPITLTTPTEPTATQNTQIKMINSFVLFLDSTIYLFRVIRFYFVKFGSRLVIFTRCLHVFGCGYIVCDAM